jgi:RNA polymerase sigma-70 factor, ECF subfamily
LTIRELDNETALALLARVAARDEAAFRRIYEAVSKRIYAFALHRTGDAMVAGEVMTETMYQIWRQPQSFRGEAKFSTWVLGIARHKMIDRLRATAPEHDDIEDYSDTLLAETSEPFDMVAEQQRREAVFACIEKLSGPQRESLYLVFYEGMSLGEASEVQAVPEGTVKTRLFHARSKIKQCLAKLLEREGEHG